MVNNNYVKGARFERELAKKLELKGFTVFRTAGSHGACDLIAVKEGLISFVQCKASNKRVPASMVRDSFLKLSTLPKQHLFPISLVAVREKGKITLWSDE
jgi:Holliday junction resolvase